MFPAPGTAVMMHIMTSVQDRHEWTDKSRHVGGTEENHSAKREISEIYEAIPIGLWGGSHTVMLLCSLPIVLSDCEISPARIGRCRPPCRHISRVQVDQFRPAGTPDRSPGQALAATDYWEFFGGKMAE
jgi:hypothetical protein